MVKEEKGQRPEERLGDKTVDIKDVTLKSSCSFQDSGPEIRLRRMGIRKTKERQNRERVDMEGEEGVARDRRTRIFSSTGKREYRTRKAGNFYSSPLIIFNQSIKLDL